MELQNQHPMDYGNKRRNERATTQLEMWKARLKTTATERQIY